MLGLIDLPVLLWGQADARAVCAAALVGPTVAGRRGPGGRDELRDGQPGGKNFLFQGRDILVIHQFMIYRRDGVLPKQFFLGNLRAKVACARSHVAMRQLEPGPREGIGKQSWILVETPRDFFVDGIDSQRDIGGQHGRFVTLGGIVGIRHSVRRFAFRLPLMRAARALREFPFVLEQVFEETVAPFRRSAAPCHFQAARNCVTGDAGCVGTRPAQALLLNRRAFRLFAQVGAGSGSVGLPEGVAACDQRDGFFVVHGHARESLADILRCRQRIRLAFRAFGVHINEAHRRRAQGICQIAITRIAFLRPHPGRFHSPVDVQVRFPNVRSSAGKAESLEAHRFQCDVARENHQIGPGNFLAIFLFDGPEQATRPVEVDVVRPAVQRSETLLTSAAAAATVTNPVGSGAVPRHANKQRTVVTEVRRPPVLRIRHQRRKILLQPAVVQALELFGVIKISAHGVGQR